jgi:drug/metabolite transporter (DMT)-like permease
VVALAVSALFEGYRPTPLAWAGVALALVGNVLMLRRA